MIPIKAKEKLVFLNSFLRNQIDSAQAERKNNGHGTTKANKIIEETTRMRHEGATEEDLMDYVKN